MVEERGEGSTPPSHMGEGCVRTMPLTQETKLPQCNIVELGQMPTPNTTPIAISSGEGTSGLRNPFLLVLHQLYRFIKHSDEEKINSTMEFFENSSFEELERNIIEFQEIYAPPSRVLYTHGLSIERSFTTHIPAPPPPPSTKHTIVHSSDARHAKKRAMKE